MAQFDDLQTALSALAASESTEQTALDALAALANHVLTENTSLQEANISLSAQIQDLQSQLVAAGSPVNLQPAIDALAAISAVQQANNEKLAAISGLLTPPPAA